MTTFADVMRLRDAVTIASNSGNVSAFEIAADAKLDAVNDVLENGTEADKLMTKALCVIDYGHDV